MVQTLPWRGQKCPVAHELFATTCDAYITLGQIEADEQTHYTADGRSLTKSSSRDRLARCICADRDLFSPRDAVAAAEAIRTAQLAKLGIAIHAVVDGLSARPSSIIISGKGEFLARMLVPRLRLDVECVSLSDVLGSRLSECATAHALAVLAIESRGNGP